MLSYSQVESVKQAAADVSLTAMRYELAAFAGGTFAQAGDELHAVGSIFGGDRVAGRSPFGHGSDEIVAVSMLLRIGSQLTTASADLFKSGRHYAAAALLRQLVEIEYLAWAFQTKDEDAERWLRSDAEERRKFFTPAKLRAAAQGKFRGQDYGYHCELGGHPVPGAHVLLRDDAVVSQLLVADMLGHVGRIWDHIVGWAEGNDWAVPVHRRKREMLQNFVAWKSADSLTLLPPPP